MERCPEHAQAGDVNPPWPCPHSDEYECEYFLDELERRINDVVEHGNFIRSWSVDGVTYTQKFVNHEPVSEPVPRWFNQAGPLRHLPQDP